MDPIAIQKNIKDNAEDLQTYLRDLGNWESDMKRKDAELRGVNMKETSYSEVRSKSKEIKVYDDKKLLESKSSQNTQRISGFDYSSWDKLDVDKVCDEIDKKEAQKMREVAIYEKERGNNYVKAGNWEEAINCYTKAIKSCPNDAIFFANRALCYLKMKDFHKAERDSTKAIELDSNYAKAWLRRYAAHEGLGKMEIAKCDLQRVLELEPYNLDAQAKLTALEKCLKEQEEVKHPERRPSLIKTEEQKLLELQENVFGPKVFGPESSGNGNSKLEELPSSWKSVKGTIIEPVEKPPHLRSKKPLRRVPITEGFVNNLAPVVSAIQISKTASNTHQKAITQEQGGDNVELAELPPPEVPAAPRTSVQFLLAWKMIKSHPEMAIKYLQFAFKVAVFISVIKQLLDSCVKNGACSSEEAADVASKYML
ncbi:hypothetical protein J437_LFUL006908 [Ladona fulva]|uniref:RNA polymerase II-associated protein 3 n=1 Tax=Ladona fulva TaxID=123851 RepID=A0A8K0NYU2_LADFU|nr:hypothetical protein J437_LFUL006908 [Ladona fulva]